MNNICKYRIYILFYTAIVWKLLCGKREKCTWYRNNSSEGNLRIIVTGDSQTHVVMPYLVLSCGESLFFMVQRPLCFNT